MTDLQSIQAGWDQAATEDAMFNILTIAGRQNGGWDTEEFFAHGRAEIDAAMDRLHELGVGGQVRSGGHTRRRRALDFGCGIGRLTNALAGHFDRVDGVDVSREMIDRANDLNAGHHARYFHNPESDLHLFDDGSYDLVYSMIVLQHMPQPLQQGYVSEFFRVLRPGGVAMFQVPDGPEYMHPNKWLSMYGVPRATVEQWIVDASGTLVDIEDLGQDSGWRALRYTAVAA